MGGHEPRQASKSDLPAITETLGRAFDDDPVTDFLVSGLDSASRRKRVNRIERALVAPHLVDDATWVTPGFESVAVWAPPGRWEISPFRMARHAWAFVYGMRLRMVRALRILPVIEGSHPADPPHWYLALLGTHPDHQGRGFGSAAMRPVLRQCDQDGVGAYLESSKESNIPFYERYGFRVTKDLVIRGGPTLYGMWRDPTPPEN